MYKIKLAKKKKRIFLKKATLNANHFKSEKKKKILYIDNILMRMYIEIPLIFI